MTIYITNTDNMRKYYFKNKDMTGQNKNISWSTKRQLCVFTSICTLYYETQIQIRIHKVNTVSEQLTNLLQMCFLECWGGGYCPYNIQNVVQAISRTLFYILVTNLNLKKFSLNIEISNYYFIL